MGARMAQYEASHRQLSVYHPLGLRPGHYDLLYLEHVNETSRRRESEIAGRS